MPQFSDKILKQAFEIWFEPELKKRIKNGEFDEDFNPWAVQVIMIPQESNQINFNHEVVGEFKGKPNSEIKPGQKIEILELHKFLDQIDNFTLPRNEYLDAGHFSAIRHQKGWLIAFDFRYNYKNIQQHLSSAKEYLDSAKYNFENKNWRVFIDNLHTASELIGKSFILLLRTDQDILSVKTHKSIKSELNRETHKRNGATEFKDIFNYLSEIRNTAKYSHDEDFTLEIEKAQKYLSEVNKMYKATKDKAPRR